MIILFILIGGFVGAISRFLISSKMNAVKSIKPFGTWTANVSGSILLGFLFVLYTKNNLSDSLWHLFGVGFCGSFTTFSTFGTETLSLILAGKIQNAFIYVCLSLFSSISIVFLIFFSLK